ncbi:MAG: NADH-quinone oxidoreductase subunit H [Candidatus Omnitrophica bacterium]|nr:NADH-quinone oxidoreductase subunit H [Candidatus Omnitrophota bacterium]
MTMILVSFVQCLLLIALAPSVSWFLKKIKAASQNRVGPGLAQVYGDLAKLFRKDMVISGTASWVFHAVPFVLLASTLAVASMVPVLGTGSLFGFAGDAILFAYLLALGRFSLTLAALDTGTTFGGMGSSREMTLSSLAEPAILLALFALGLRAGTLSLEGIVAYFGGQSPLEVLFFTSLAFGALLIVTLAECGKVPVDNPATHLELTMVHEAMVLEYSGRYLALIEWSHQIKQVVLLALLAGFFLPWGTPVVPGLLGLVLAGLVFLLKIFFLAFIIGWIEVHTAKLRLFRTPDLLAVGFVLAILSLLAQLIIGRGG